MAKTPKVKKREVSFHSRAARRGVPPSAELQVKGAVEQAEYKPWLHNVQNAGISKKPKTKQLSRQQKMRQQKVLERADRNANRLEKKVADSKARAKIVDARRADWDELNNTIMEKDGEVKKQVMATETGLKADAEAISAAATPAALPMEGVDGAAGLDQSISAPLNRNQTPESADVNVADEIDEVT